MLNMEVVTPRLHCGITAQFQTMVTNWHFSLPNKSTSAIFGVLGCENWCWMFCLHYETCFAVTVVGQQISS